MNLGTESFTQRLNLNSGTNYILRTYLGAQQGVPAILLSQSDNLTAARQSALQLSGTAAPTGAY
jgi:hypothetical protein